MLSRIAKVVWWLGLLIASIGTLGYVAEAYERIGCTATLKELAEVTAANDALWKQYERDHPKSNDFANALAMLDGSYKTDPRDTPELRSAAEKCQRPIEMFGLMAGWVLAFILWALAYILGGSFWLPPRTKRPALGTKGDA